MDKKKTFYIVVVWYGGIPYMLQYRNVINWCFCNNSIKLFKGIMSAKKGAYKLSHMFKYDSIKVYSVYEGDGICTDFIRMWERDESERVVFELVK